MLPFSLLVLVLTQAVAHGAPLTASWGPAGDAKYHILAFGDSLTEGLFHSHEEGGNVYFHPYALKLQKLLKEGSFPVKVHERGVSGQRVVGEMESRLPELLRSAEEHGIRFQWVIILGGTNDLGYREEPARIMEGLRSLYAAARSHGARVLALTVLHTRYGTHRPQLDVPRQQLNELIRAEAANSSFVSLLEAEKLFPYPLDFNAEPAAAAMWNDILHLSPAGYDVLGEHVFEALRGSLKTER